MYHNIFLVDINKFLSIFMLQLELKNKLKNKRKKESTFYSHEEIISCSTATLVYRIVYTCPKIYCSWSLFRVWYDRQNKVTLAFDAYFVTHHSGLIEIICILMLMVLSGCNFLHPCAQQSRSSVD